MHTCSVCGKNFKMMNSMIKHKRNHMGRTTPIYDPLNKQISNFAAPKKNSVWTGKGVQI